MVGGLSREYYRISSHGFTASRSHTATPVVLTIASLKTEKISRAGAETLILMCAIIIISRSSYWKTVIRNCIGRVRALHYSVTLTF